MIQKIIAGLLLCAALVWAEGIRWEKDIATAIKKGRQLNKPVMVLVSKDGCHWCDHMRESTLKNPEVVKRLNSDFISVEGYTNRGEVPRDLMTGGTPGTWFVKNGEPMFQPLMGALPADQYLEALDVVSTEFRKIKK